MAVVEYDRDATIYGLIYTLSIALISGGIVLFGYGLYMLYIDSAINFFTFWFVSELCWHTVISLTTDRDDDLKCLSRVALTALSVCTNCNFMVLFLRHTMHKKIC